MEGQIAAKPARSKPRHLICGSKLWTLLGFFCCAYFAKVAVSRIHGVTAWSHDPWEIGTHLIWMVFMIGLMSETRCRKEKLLFGLLMANFGFGFAMGLWSGASDQVVQETRIISAVAWGVAALVSLALMFAKGSRSLPGEAE